MFHFDNSGVMNHELKHRKLVFEFSITGHATPASKTVSSDLPGVCFIATEGLLTPVTDIEAISGLTNYTAPNDSNGIFDVMLKGSELVGNGSLSKVLGLKVQEKASAGWLSPTIQSLGAAWAITAGGNIAFEVDSATDLSAAATTKFVVEVDYLLYE